MASAHGLSPGRRRLVLVVAITTIGLETALLGVIAPLLPQIEERTGVGEATLGLVLAAYAIPTLLLSIPAGRLTDRIGRRPMLLCGLALTGAGSLLVAGSDSIGWLLGARATQGLGATASWVAALALVADLAPPDRKGEAIGFALAANSCGAIAGPALGGIAGGQIGFEAPFLIVAAIAAIALGGGALIVPRRRGLEGRPPARAMPARRILGQPSVMAPAALAIAGASLLGLIDFVVPLDLDQRLGASSLAIGLLFAVAAGLDAIASPLAGRRGDTRGRAPVVRAGWLAVGCSGGLLIVLPDMTGVGFAIALFAVGQSIVFAGVIPWLEERVGEFDRGLAFGALNLVFASGYTIGPIVGGWALDGVGPRLAFGLVVAVAASSYLLVRRDPPPLGA